MRQLLTREPIPTASENPVKEGDEGVDEEAMEDEEHDPFSAAFGYKNSITGESTLDGTNLTLKKLHMAFPTRDLPELTRWLTAKGCGNLRYGVEKPDYSNLLKSIQNLE